MAMTGMPLDASVVGEVARVLGFANLLRTVPLALLRHSYEPSVQYAFTRHLHILQGNSPHVGFTFICASLTNTHTHVHPVYLSLFRHNIRIC